MENKWCEYAVGCKSFCATTLSICGEYGNRRMCTIYLAKQIGELGPVSKPEAFPNANLNEVFVHQGEIWTTSKKQDKG